MVTRGEGESHDLYVEGKGAYLFHCPKFSSRSIIFLNSQWKIQIITIVNEAPEILNGNFDNQQTLHLILRKLKSRDEEFIPLLSVTFNDTKSQIVLFPF